MARVFFTIRGLWSFSHRHVGIAVLNIAVILNAGVQPTQAAKFMGLGDLSGGSFSSSAYGVSADGTVVVGQGNSTSGLEAFRWTASGMVGVGDLPGGSFNSFATGVSADGSVVVGSGSSTSGTEAYRWMASGMAGLGDLPGGSFLSSAQGVSTDGSVIVGRGTSASGSEAFLRTSAGGMVGLGDFTGGSFSSQANGISDDGLIVVGWGTSASGTEAFRWTSGDGMVGLGDLDGGVFFSIANAASADGSTIVGSANDNFPASGEAFRWTSGDGMVSLGNLPGGDFISSRASDVSADGSVVVGLGISASGFEAFIWDALNGMQRLKDVLVPSLDAALNGWTLSEARAISADGRTIVGGGINPSGNGEAWLAYLADDIYWRPNTSGAWDSAINWRGPFAPGSGDSVEIDPTAALTVTGPAAHTTINSLSIGGSGVGRVTLSLAGMTNGDLNVATFAYLNPNAELMLANGRSFSVGVALYNSGVIRGTGTISADLVNYAGGEVRVATGEALVVNGGGHTNDGKIEAIGGEIEFIGAVTNSASTGFVTGRDTTIRFRDGLTNDGSVALTNGINDVFGDIINNGAIIVSGGASAIFYDDIVQDGTFRVNKVGSTTSTAVILGDFSGSGGSSGGGDIFFEGDLRPGNSPAIVSFANNVGLGAGATLVTEIGGLAAGTQYDRVSVTGSLDLGGTLDVDLINGFVPAAGNAFDILDFNPATLSGVFDTISLPALAGGLAWDTSQLYITGMLSVNSAGVPGDYNNNGVADAADYVLWRKGGPLTNEVDTPGVVNEADYTAWRARFGNSAGAGSGAAAAVPESMGIAVLIFAAASCCLPRHRISV